MNFTEWFGSLPEDERAAIGSARDAESGWNAAMLVLAASEEPEISSRRVRLVESLRNALKEPPDVSHSPTSTVARVNREDMRDAIQLLSARSPWPSTSVINALQLATEILCNVDHPQEAAQIALLLGEHGSLDEAERASTDKADLAFVDRQAAIDAVLGGVHELWLSDTGFPTQAASAPLQDRSRPFCRICWRDDESVVRPYWTLAEDQSGTILEAIVPSIG
ncbi:hypothetical protein LMG29542_02296 [Paraburkholderia humisilvae]|uniref:Uncharacterized protein n=2 Tax=Paraburkholderia humisilvae TaxID=627669 RepID=A0A6J5DNA3_9BURK|nr:hypothetical protein LMG29542_02296 [Paraburkholderia humisilvae]